MPHPKPKKYKVTIEATIRKKIVVEDYNKDLADIQAHELFNPAEVGDDDTYYEETLDIEELDE